MKKEVFPADLGHLYDMLGFIKSYGLSENINQSILEKIILACEEALVNIIHYSYPNRKGTIEITCQESSNKHGITVYLVDNGVPFNPIVQCPIKNDHTPPIPSLDDSKKGGYGIYIFVGIMDHIEYQRLEEGNLLALTKYF